MSVSAKPLLAGLVLAAALSSLAFAEPATPPPPGAVPHGHKDARLATAGTYALDNQHAGVIASVSHVGFSRSIFRFDKVEGALTWDPVHVEKSSLTVKVQTASIAANANVEGFSHDLSTNYLKSPQFPQAVFVSTGFRQTDATHGKVEGKFTLMGKTVPVTFDVTLIGAGPFFGQERIGVHAVANINPQDFGMPSVFDEPIELIIDTEFFKGEMKLG
ncbi:MAG: polyisoprenoid-binding protein [Caulobacter sp.]|nr:polyisoprenoid-binding protein [Caulobacter sp.]